MQVSRIECDNCGIVTERKSGHRTPNKWFRIERIKLVFRVTDKNDKIGDKNVIDIEERKDPDFCTKSCLMEWLEQKVDEISKK